VHPREYKIELLIDDASMYAGQLGLDDFLTNSTTVTDL
jgi:hypothetical protein